MIVSQVFLSTLSLRRATQAANGLTHAPPQISIHALLAESDILSYEKATKITKFLSTLSLRRATCKPCRTKHSTNSISIHALLAESDGVCIAHIEKTLAISIHALLAESDEPSLWMKKTPAGFLSTLSLRRATQAANGLTHAPPQISIHALLAESDSKSAQNSGALLRI